MDPYPVNTIGNISFEKAEGKQLIVKDQNNKELGTIPYHITPFHKSQMQQVTAIDDKGRTTNFTVKQDELDRLLFASNQINEQARGQKSADQIKRFESGMQTLEELTRQEGPIQNNALKDLIRHLASQFEEAANKDEVITRLDMINNFLIGKTQNVPTGRYSSSEVPAASETDCKAVVKKVLKNYPDEMINEVMTALKQKSPRRGG